MDSGSQTWRLFQVLAVPEGAITITVEFCRKIDERERASENAILSFHLITFPDSSSFSRNLGKRKGNLILWKKKLFHFNLFSFFFAACSSCSYQIVQLFFVSLFFSVCDNNKVNLGNIKNEEMPRKRKGDRRRKTMENLKSIDCLSATEVL